MRVLILVCFLVAGTTASAQQGKSAAETTGDRLQVLIPLAGYGATFIMDDTEGRTQFYKSFFMNLGITYTLKYSINDKRPDNHGGQSFPSGHTSAAFQGAAFIQNRYGWAYGIPAYLGAAYVGYSRVEGETDRHYVDDVLAGAVIGILSSYYFTTPYKGVIITPVADDGYYGIAIGKRW